MLMQPDGERLYDLLDSLVFQQRAKVLALAREITGMELSEEEVRNPHDFKALRQSEHFNFEDGILAGYLSIQMVLKAQGNPCLDLDWLEMSERTHDD